MSCKPRQTVFEHEAILVANIVIIRELFRFTRRCLHAGNRHRGWRSPRPRLRVIREGEPPAAAEAGKGVLLVRQSCAPPVRHQHAAGGNHPGHSHQDCPDSPRRPQGAIIAAILA